MVLGGVSGIVAVLAGISRILKVLAGLYIAGFQMSYKGCRDLSRVLVVLVEVFACF